MHRRPHKSMPGVIDEVEFVTVDTDDISTEIHETAVHEIGRNTAAIENSRYK